MNTNELMKLAIDYRTARIPEEVQNAADTLYEELEKMNNLIDALTLMLSPPALLVIPPVAERQVTGIDVEDEVE